MPIEVGANVQARIALDGRTPLHDAATSASHEAALALLKYGAEVNAKTNAGVRPLHYAACSAGKEGAAQVVDVLLRWCRRDGYG